MDAWPVETIRESDAVRLNGKPRGQFVVIAIHEEKAWIEDLVSGRGQIVELSACQRLSTLH
jgi:hypothetical protein